MNCDLWGRKQLINARDLMLSLTHSFPFSVVPVHCLLTKANGGFGFFFATFFPFSLAASHETAQSECKQLRKTHTFILRLVVGRRMTGS